MTNPRRFSLTRIVSWSHQLVTEILGPGDLAVDLTAGRGRDTLVLARAVGASGRVLAFDLQPAAIDQTARFLAAHDFGSRRLSEAQTLPNEPGIFLVQGCHSVLDTVLEQSPRAIIANLGYLPGGDPGLVTRVETTQQALRLALALLAPGGRLAVTVYPAHPGGAAEADSTRTLFHELPGEHWQVLSLVVANQPAAPFLLVAERRA